MISKAKECFYWDNGAYPITVFQTGVDRFSVSYGQQYKADLNYQQAAYALGESIFHALACEGRLDNDHV